MHKCLNLTKHHQSTPKLNLIIFVLKPYVTNALYLDVTKVRFCASGQGADMVKGRLSALATNGIWQGGINRINKAVCSKGAEFHYRQCLLHRQPKFCPLWTGSSVFYTFTSLQVFQGQSLFFQLQLCFQCQCFCFQFHNLPSHFQPHTSAPFSHCLSMPCRATLKRIFI